MPSLMKLTGQDFGRWTVVERAANKGRHVHWLCRCECGNTGVINSSNLTSGLSRSCGCLQIDTVTTHNKTGTPEYKTWIGMKSRCYTKTNIGYPYYGGRGIAVCERWRDNFEDFLADMGHNQTLHHSLDRIDPNGDYCPENGRWAIQETQDNNRRSNRFLTFNGKTQTVAQWAKEVGITRGALLSRLAWGWPIEDAITWPAERGRTNPHNIKPSP